MKKNLKKWIFNYMIYGYFFSLILINLYSYIEFRKLDFSLRILIGSFFMGFAFLAIVSIYKYLFLELIKTWKSSGIVGKILLIMGIGYVGAYVIIKILGVI